MLRDLAVVLNKKSQDISEAEKRNSSLQEGKADV